ncbi:hypothetical protein [Jeotgalibacillus marinus]|uniref:ABC transporter permease n=1 Tax=Jeotgalibacillus marinus TaxID=86667 RepID=A0ABV3Q233_9BACL
MSDFMSLRFLDRFEKGFNKVGIEYPLLRHILKIKLTMDSRRIPTVYSQQKVDESKDKNHFLRSLWIYALYGLAVVPFLFFADQYFFQMSIIFGVLMFILMTSMISDFSAVLLDIRDRAIIGPKPINKRTLSAAKMIHVSIYMFFLTTATVAVPLVVSLFSMGIGFFLLFLLEVILLVMLILVLTACIYIFILRFFDGERLKNMINYIQILLTIGIFIGYQVVIRSFEFIAMEINFTPAWWQLLTPPVWFGALHEVILQGERSIFVIILAVMAILIPILMMILYVRLMPTFEHQLQKLSHTEVGVKKRQAKWKKTFVKWISPNKEERSVYYFARSMMKSEREFKLKVYPSLGFAIVVPFIFMFSMSQASSFDDLRDGNSYYFIYFSLLVIPTIFSMVKYSSGYKGSWIYEVASIQHRSSIYSGTLKAGLVTLFFPVFFIQCIVFLWLFSYQIFVDLLVVLMSSIIYSTASLKVLSNRAFPFSESFSLAQHKESGKVFGLILVIVAFYGLHSVSSLFPNGTYVYAVILFISMIVTWKMTFRK